MTHEPTPTTHQVPTSGGRTLTVEVAGPDHGPVLLFLHSAPGARGFDPDPAATAASGRRLVTFDRAGYGSSDPLPDGEVPTIGRHAADAARVVEALEAGAVDVVGWSAGGRIGAALAASRPELVRSLAIVATPAPDDVVPWVGDEYRAMAAELRTSPSTAMASLVPQFAGLVDAIAADEAVAVAQVSGGPGDEAMLAHRPELRSAVAAMVRASVSTGATGMAADIVADQVSPWGFDRADVRARTTCWYGAADETVGPAHGTWWAEGIRGASCTTVPEIGHLVVTASWPDILAAADRS
ncbi:alpha/beta hydrolase [soil metagenome]